MNADPIKEIVSFAKFGALPIFADLLCDVTCSRFCPPVKSGDFEPIWASPRFTLEIIDPTVTQNSTL
jgi:hypothetical protein